MGPEAVVAVGTAGTVLAAEKAVVVALDYN